MHMLFVDESGSAPEADKVAQNPVFVLGGLVLREDVWIDMARSLASLKRHHGIQGEIKWRHFAPDKGARPSALSHLAMPGKEDLRSELYRIIRRQACSRILCVVADTEQAYACGQVRTASDLYWSCYERLTDRFLDFLDSEGEAQRTRQHGIVVCDHRGAKDDALLRELHHRLFHHRWDTTDRVAALVEGLFIAPSHLSVGIQFADLVAGAVYRRYRHDDHRFVQQLQECFHRSRRGCIEGYGIVMFPENDWGSHSR